MTCPRSLRPALLALVACLVAPLAAAQAPAGYYDTVDASSAATLRSSLHAVIDDHQRFPFTSGGTDTWDILELADEDPGNAGRILDVYRNASYPKQGGGNSFYSREHSWPSSLGFPNDSGSNYPYSDCHGLFLSDDAYNGARSNKPYRNCDPTCAEWPTDPNAGAGGGSGSYPGNSNWTTGFQTAGTWETWNGRRGDVARAILYLDVRYEGGTHGGTGASEPDLIVTNDEALIIASATGNNESVAYMGIRDVLLQWAAEDPVDAKELARNDAVFAFQGNRNPFIDHPEWIDILWGTGTATGELWINEFHYDNGGADVGEFVEVAGTAGLNLAGYRILAYNGGDGAPYGSVDLVGLVPDAGGCLGTVSFAFPDLQNGSPDGLALVDPLDNVLEFWSYEGAFTATDGPAFGLTSTDVGVEESAAAPLGLALARIGTGTTGADFAWGGPQAESPGALNAGQVFGDACTAPTGPPAPTGLAGVSCAGAVKLTWTGSLDPGVTGYGVYRSSFSGFGYVPLPGSPVTSPTYLDTGASSGTTAYYVVTAIDGSGESDFSTELAIGVQGGGAAGTPWINELHYDDESTDDGEFVEVAGPAGLDLNGWILVGYNGSTQVSYSSVNLSGTIADEAGCVGALAFPFAGLQNGAPDGIALVDPQGNAVEFISYEGSFTASGGAADGMLSTDIGVSETNSTPAGLSLQRTGSGFSAGDFGGWAGPTAQTPGAVNAGQSFVGGCATLVQAYGCGLNPAGSLQLLSGNPTVGATLVFGVDNPTGNQTVGSISLLLISLSPDPGFPCGTPIPGFGMGGPGLPGELLISTLPGQLIQPTLVGPAWAGAGSPAPIAIAVPFDCVLAGLVFYVQGALIDPFGPTGIGLTEGARVTLAN
ncbi:endonuclease [Engelhardtia mirabilis]|uniref:Extracellular ribonuclease n=1 Tax=Engelhardtia mirabilis TaxID=2528011 RepID=A0A518BGC8_9BACT|nr:Extracellular ribonuclease precursor [Planctomycetes bacterium Pla133]QDV00366.1 Extracellular ribonuclease precursor [Planctomycetes bacterium Pla86]